MENRATSNATIINPTAVRISKDGKYLLIALPGNLLVCKPINYFKAILNSLTPSVQIEAEV